MQPSFAGHLMMRLFATPSTRRPKPGAHLTRSLEAECRIKLEVWIVTHANTSNASNVKNTATLQLIAQTLTLAAIALQVTLLVQTVKVCQF